MEKRDVIISVNDVSAGYGREAILDHVTFEVFKGEILVIAGGSGCGKTALLKNMVGLNLPLAGSVVMNGITISRSAEGDLHGVFRSLGMLFQAGALFGSMTIGENCALPLHEFTRLPHRAVRSIVRMKLGLVGLAGYENHYPAELSGGMRKRAGIARAMALDPPILFFDELSAGLDPVTSVELDKLILRINEGMGTTMVIVSHEIASIFQIAHRVILLDKNARGIIAEGAPRTLQQDAADRRVWNFFNRRDA